MQYSRKNSVQSNVYFTTWAKSGFETGGELWKLIFLVLKNVKKKKKIVSIT